jgi:hypothetical protein
MLRVTRGYAGQPIRRLELRVAIPAAEAAEVRPVLKILIDGQELLADTGYGGHIGWYPDVILGDDEPLLPADPARRVVLYICGCGEAGDSCVAAVVCAAGDLVTWTDFRQFRGWDTSGLDPPVVERDHHAGAAIDFPDLVFDAGQYTAEVRRVSAGRVWASERWQTAELLYEYLHPGHPWPSGENWEPGRIQPHDDQRGSFSVEIWDDSPESGGSFESGLIVTLVPGAGPPEDRAREMADFLMTTPPERWPVTRRIQPGGWRDAGSLAGDGADEAALA